MTSGTLDRGRTRVALAWRPEWPVAVVATSGWVALIILDTVQPRGAAYAAHGVAGIGVWALMSAAMMLPPTLPAVRHVAVNSMRYRRRRAITTYVTAYLFVWIVTGIPVLALGRMAVDAGIDDRMLLAGTFVAGVGWQLTPWKRRALAGCRRTVALRPIGWRAGTACARFGLAQAWRCAISTWPLMLMTSVAGHVNLIAMVVATMVVVVEERAMVRTPGASVAGVLATAAAAVLLI